jgi:hypothetical protein
VISFSRQVAGFDDMALTQTVVDDFIAAPKVVKAPKEVRWNRIGTDLLRWDAVIESEDVIRGRLWLDFNTAHGKYAFNLQLQGTTVYGWLSARRGGTATASAAPVSPGAWAILTSSSGSKAAVFTAPSCFRG